MSNQRRNVHKSGPIGMLLDSGEIDTIEGEAESLDTNLATSLNLETQKPTYQTKSGIKFIETELIHVDPTECEPWRYANRQKEEVGDIAELIESIRLHKQLQPALIRPHPEPHGKIKYEIIFGCRRYIACLQLNIPLLAIRKDFFQDQDAIAYQDAENRYRNDISSYSNAKLYKKLLNDGVFKEEGDIAKKLGLSKSTFSELMTFNKIPDAIVQKIPNIHNLSIRFAVKIINLLKQGSNANSILMKVAPLIGKTINSPEKLEKVVLGQPIVSKQNQDAIKSYSGADGKKLFTVKRRSSGEIALKLDKKITAVLDYEELYVHIKNYLEKINVKFGAPN